MVEETKLAVGQCGHVSVDVRLPTGDVQRDSPDSQDGLVPFRVPATNVDLYTRYELIEREWLGKVVACTELEAAELRLQVASRGEDENGDLQPTAPKFGKHVQPPGAWQQQVEDDQVELLLDRTSKPGFAVVLRLDDEALCCEASPDERPNSRLVLDDQDSHLLTAAENNPAEDDLQMTGR